MFSTPFADDIFQKATFAFKVQSGDSIIDERGSIQTRGETIEHIFKLAKTNPTLRREYEVSQLDELYYGTVIDSAKLDPRIRPGDVGEGKIRDRKCICIIKSLSQSSINLISEILGEKYLIQVSYRSRSNAGT